MGKHTWLRLGRTLDTIRWYPFSSLFYTIGLHPKGLEGKRFVLGGRSYPYFLHPYNHTWVNERAVELPVAHAFLSGGIRPMLEIGNVTSHYWDACQPVLDKYENCPFRAVINADFMSGRFRGQFQRILAISTFEHIGTDDGSGDPSKALRAIERIKSLLAPGGKALITIPVGYNKTLDQGIANTGGRIAALKRISKQNTWEETDLKSALQTTFNSPFPCANAVIFAWYERAK